MNNTPWSEQELDVLEKHYPKHGARGVVIFVNRTPLSITCKANRLGINCGQGLNQYNAWTSEEIEFLELWYEPCGAKWCSKKLNRSYNSVLQKAFTLKLKWNRPYKGGWNGNWQGGLTPQNIILRHSEEYNQWRLQVLKRDNFTCQNCKNIGKNLQVHHIKEFSKNSELRFDINNGITLCDVCHSKVHGRPILLWKHK